MAGITVRLPVLGAPAVQSGPASGQPEEFEYVDITEAESPLAEAPGGPLGNDAGDAAHSVDLEEVLPALDHPEPPVAPTLSEGSVFKLPRIIDRTEAVHHKHQESARRTTALDGVTKVRHCAIACWTGPGCRGKISAWQSEDV